MPVLRWNPVDELKALRHDMVQWVKRCRAPFSPGWTGRGEERAMRLPLDAYTTADEIIVRAAVPGLDAEDVEVTLEGDTLTIAGTFRVPTKHADYLFQELVTGPFRREVILHVPIRVDQVQARFEKGMLTVILPKGGVVHPKVVGVSTTSAENWEMS